MPHALHPLARIGLGAAAIASLGACLVALAMRASDDRAAARLGADLPALRTMRIRLATPPIGRERLLVLIGSAACSAAQRPGFADTVRAVVRAAERVARDSGYAFATVGVSIDPSATRGLDFLERVGPFDEVSLGRSWLNSSVVRLVWRDHAGLAAIPQIVLVDRSVRVDSSVIEVGPDTVVARMVDMADMRAFLRRTGAAAKLARVSSGAG
jgi:hypothetical protein